MPGGSSDTERWGLHFQLVLGESNQVIGVGSNSILLMFVPLFLHCSVLHRIRHKSVNPFDIVPDQEKLSKRHRKI